MRRKIKTVGGGDTLARDKMTPKKIKTIFFGFFLSVCVRGEGDGDF